MFTPKAKDKINHVLGQCGILVNLDKSAILDLSSSKLDFEAPPSGWNFYGLTEQGLNLTLDQAKYESKIGNPEFTYKSFIVGQSGTLEGNFLQVDAQLHDLLAGNRDIVNIGGLVAPIAITSANAESRSVVVADCSSFIVGNAVVACLAADVETSMNVATITRIDTATDTLYFDDSWFDTLPTAAMVLDQPMYRVAQLGTSQLPEMQVMIVFESKEGVQFVYHFPLVQPNASIKPTFSTTGEVAKLAFGFTINGVENTQHGDGDSTILGYFYELMKRKTA